jgi:hypothetical protein
VNSLEGNIFSGVRSTTDSGHNPVQATTALAASFKATDGKGTVIEDNSVTKSAEMTITGYSDVSFSTHNKYIAAVVIPLLFRGFLLENITLLS